MSAKITGKVIVLPVKPFKTESKRILDLMIHSIYTHREIFLRELISNASDAIDKLYFQSLTDPKVGMSREDFTITLAADKVQRTLTVSDNGCGMTADDLENNLGTIAQSGTSSAGPMVRTPPGAGSPRGRMAIPWSRPSGRPGAPTSSSPSRTTRTRTTTTSSWSPTACGPLSRSIPTTSAIPSRCRSSVAAR